MLFLALDGLFAGLALVRIAARGTFADACGIEETGYTIGRLRANAQPMLGAVTVKDNATGIILGKQRVIAADALDKLAVARAALIGNDDLVIRALLRTTTRQTNCNCHLYLPLLITLFLEHAGRHSAHHFADAGHGVTAPAHHSHERFHTAHFLELLHRTRHFLMHF